MLSGPEARATTPGRRPRPGRGLWGRGSGSAHPIGAREAPAAPPEEAALALSAATVLAQRPSPGRGGPVRRRSALTLRRRARRRAR